MNTTNSFVPPQPGQTAMFYCHICRQSFFAKVEKHRFLKVFALTAPRARCPDCKRYCGLDTKIQY